MPRTNNANLSQIETFLARVALFKQSDFVNRQNFQELELLAFRNFRDKAFKAFYARKILRLPASIAAEVFGVTVGLISQAEATEVTLSRSGSSRNPNVYSAANRNSSSLNELGKFAIPNRRGADVGIEITNGDRKQIFINFAKLAIVQNRGADIVSFQPRMVASYMDEGAANSLKSYTLPRWRERVFDYYARSSEQTTQAATPEPTPTASRAILQFSSEDAITDLIREGMDRDGASQLVEAFNDIGLAVYVSRERDRALELRVPGTDGSLRAPSRDEVVRVFNSLNTISLVTVDRVSDRMYRAIVTFPGQSSQASQAPASESTESLSYEPTAMNFMRMSAVNAEVLTLVAAGADRDTATRLIEALLNRKFNFSTRSRQANVVSYRLQYFGRITDAPDSVAIKQLIESILRLQSSDVTMGVRQGDLVGQITLPRAEASAQAETQAEPTATAAEAEPTLGLTTVEELRPNQREVLGVGLLGPERVEETLTRFQAMGYSPMEVKRTLNFLHDKGLFIFRLNSNVQGGNTATTAQGQSYQMTPFNIMEVQTIGNLTPRRFRTSTWVNWCRVNLRSGVFPDARANSQAGRRQRVTFRNRLGANIGFLHLPNLARLDAQNAAPATQTSQATTTAQPTTSSTPTRNVYFLGYQQAPAGQLFRSGNVPFIRLSEVQETGEFSYMLYWWNDVDGNIYQLPAGRMNLRRGQHFRDLPVLSQISQDPPGELKLYTSNDVQSYVAQSVLAFMDRTPPASVSFTPQRLPTRVADFRIRVQDYDFALNSFLQVGGRDRRLATLANVTNRRIQRSDTPAGSTTTASTTPSITLLTRSQLKTLATSPYSFGFGIEFEGFIREGTRKELSGKMRQDGIKIYTTKGYRSKTPVSGEESYKRGATWRQESDGSVMGYDARSSGGSDPTGQGQTFEMVSEVLNSSSDNKSGNNNWIPELETFCDSLAKNGVLIDPSSGIHIHVGYPNFNAEQTKNLFINSVLMIPVLKGLVSEAWKDRFYAKFPSDSNLTTKLSRVANAGNTQSEVVSAYKGQFGYERYSYLNTSNFPSRDKPTFEYRFQGSNIEKDTMINTVRILQQIWKASLEGVIPIEQGSGKRQDSVLVDLLGNELFSFARNRYAETELPLVSVRSSKSFPGYQFPINASSIT